MPDIFFLSCAALAAVFVGLSKGGLPMIGMLGVPVLALATSPLRAAGLLLPIYIISDVFGLIAYRRDFDRRNLMILAPAAVVGIGIGWATAAYVSEAAVTLLVGAIGLAFCFDLWRKRHKTIPPKRADIPRGIVWGALTGFTSFVSHSGAPPYQMYVMPQRLTKLAFAGTTTILFAIVNAVKLIPYWALGQLSTTNLKTAAMLFPLAVGATLLGVRIVRVLPEDLFFRLVTIALFLISVKLTFDGAMGLAG